MAAEVPTNRDLSSEVDDLKRQVERLSRLLGQIDASSQALSISQFCVRNNISRSFFYKLKKSQKAPRTMSVGGRQIISPEAERDWRLEREREGRSRQPHQKGDLKNGPGLRAASLSRPK